MKFKLKKFDKNKNNKTNKVIFAFLPWKHYCTECDSMLWLEFYKLEKIEDALFYDMISPAPTEYHGKCRDCYENGK